MSAQKKNPTSSSTATTTATAKKRPISVGLKDTSSVTGVPPDWNEYVDLVSGRVFFNSEKLKKTLWGLPLDSLASTEEEKKDIEGWMVHVDPATNQKYYSHETKCKAQWKMPEVLEKYVGSCQYLQTKRSWAVARNEEHQKNAPRGSKVQFVDPPVMRRMTLRMLVQTMTLDKIFCDREAFRAFQIFSSSFHSEENVLFYCVAEAFRTRGSKAVGVLGLDDLAKVHHKGLPRTQSHLQQIALDEKLAGRLQTSVEKIQMIREAGAIFDRFLAPNAPDWVCVDQKMVESLQAKLAEARSNPSKMTREIFSQSQHYVYKNLEHDLLPRFIKAALAPNLTSSPRAGGSSTVEESFEDHLITDEAPRPLVVDGKFEPDEVLRHHLLQLQKKPEGLVTSLMGTANAYRSLFPSPRYAIEGRKGSGLAPDALTSYTESNEVLAAPTNETADKMSAKKGALLSLAALPRPMSLRASFNGGKKRTGPKNGLDLAEEMQKLEQEIKKKQEEEEEEPRLGKPRSNSTGSRKASKSDLLADLRLEDSTLQRVRANSEEDKQASVLSPTASEGKQVGQFIKRSKSKEELDKLVAIDMDKDDFFIPA